MVIAAGTTLTTPTLENDAGTVAINGALDGALENASGATVNVASTGSVSGTTNNFGTMASAGTLTGIITNQASGSMTLSGGSTGGVLFNNSGTVNVTGPVTIGSIFAANGTASTTIAAGANLTTTTRFDNNGTANLQIDGTLTGILQNNGAASTVTVAASGEVTGATDNAGIIINDGTLTGNVTNSGTLSTTVTITGNVVNTGTMNTSGSITGTLDNNGAGTVTTTGNTIGITTLTQDSSGLITIAAGHTLSAATITVNTGSAGIAVGVGSTLAGTGNTLNNSATITVADGGTITDAGAINNLATGSITFAGDGTLDADTDASGAEIITNDGTITVNAGAGSTTQTVAVGADALSNQGSGTLTVNSGTMSGITTLTNSSTSASAVTVASGATLGFTTLNSSAGTMTAAGTLDGNVALSGVAVLDLNGGTITGSLDNQSTAAITLDGTVTGAFTQNNAAASTTVDGTTAFTGLTDIQSGTFVIDTNQTLTVGDAGTAQTELYLRSGASLTVGQGATLATNQSTDSMTFASGSTLTLLQGASLTGTSLLNGALVAQASGSTINSDVTLLSSSTINMADGSSFTALTINGTLTGVGGIVNLDVDLDTAGQSSDQIVATGSGASSGTIQIALNDVTIAGTYGATPTTGLILLDLDPGSTVTASASGALPQDNLQTYIYTLGTNGDGDVVLLSQLNNATAGLSGAIASSQSLVAAVINRPTSPFVTSLSSVDEGEKCRPGGWARMVGGTASATGTATTATSSVEATTDTNFAGIQIGGDSTCFNSLIQENGWDLSYGLIAGYNIARSEQAIPGIGGLVDSTTELDMDQAYAGFYMVGARGRFSFDLQGRFEKTDFTVNSSGTNPLPVNDSKFDTDAYTLSGAASYAFSVPNQPQMFFVPTVGLSTTKTSDTSLSFTDGSSLLLNETTTNIAFIGGTLAYSDFNDVTGARTALFSTLTHYKNLSDDSTSIFSDTSNATTSIISSALPDYTEISLGYSYNRELRRDSATGSLRKLSVSVRADGRFGSGFDSYGLTGQLRLQF
ncbi:MAG: hypothetical protein HRU33_02110 [Rhodobacteraceae bacterium]|nr:hypothetical protein [Paracoccaceae bacterium]